MSDDQPVLSNDQPVLSNDQPVLSNDQPVLSNDQPVLSNDQPVLSNDQPVLANDKPVLSNDQPVLSNVQDVLSNDQPVLSNDQPDLTNDKPAMVSDQPVLANDQSALASDQPALANYQPSLANDQSLDTDKPMTTSEVSDQPALTDDKPLTFSESNDQPTFYNNKPLMSSEDNDQDTLDIDKPLTITEAFEHSPLANNQPALASDQTALASDQPALCNGKQMTAPGDNVLPVLTSKQPALANDQLTLTNDQLVLTNDQLALTNDQLALTNDQLALVNDKSIASSEVQYRFNEPSKSLNKPNDNKQVICFTNQTKRKSLSIGEELNKKRRKSQNLTVSFVKSIDIFPKHLLLPDGPPEKLVKLKLLNAEKKNSEHTKEKKKAMTVTLNDKCSLGSTETRNQHVSDKRLLMTAPEDITSSKPKEPIKASEPKRKRGRPPKNKQISVTSPTQPAKRKPVSHKSTDEQESNKKKIKKDNKTCSVSFISSNTTQKICSKDLRLPAEPVDTPKPQPKHLSVLKRKEKNNEFKKKKSEKLLSRSQKLLSKSEKLSSKKKELSLKASLKKVTNRKTPTKTSETQNQFAFELNEKKRKDTKKVIVKATKTYKRKTSEVQKKISSKNSALSSPGKQQDKPQSKLLSPKKKEKNYESIKKKILKATSTEKQQQTAVATFKDSALPPSRELQNEPHPKDKKYNDYESIKKKIIQVTKTEMQRVSVGHKENVKPKKTPRKLKIRQSKKVNPFTIKRFPQCNHGRPPLSRKIQFKFGDGETRSVLATESLEISLSQQRVLTIIQLDDFPPSPTDNVGVDINGVVYAYQQQHDSTMNGKIHE